MPGVNEQVGSTIGPYKLREQIGEGGFGIVYVAEQTTPVRRKVALKVIKLGMDTKEVIARFQAERQALALMDHPNIAQVLDGGATEQGRPYFVMELVRGIPITEYCDKHMLDTSQRLKIFIQVCRAVQHAHQKGVIHRDIKPSNVLVADHDGTPVPKVIDFGVAKAINQRLAEQSIYTRFNEMIGTPMYMSPEQAEFSGLDVDTRTDVYSLGVLLYELLTGVPPFDRQMFKRASHDEIRRIIREDDPQRPSMRISTLAGEAISTLSEQRHADPRRLSRQVTGELDWLVMKALDKDRNRRYESASTFAADVERYLNNEPVEACPPSSVYRLRKFARRNKVLLITTAIVATSLLVGMGVSLWQAVEAHDARKLADQRFEDEQQARRDTDTQRDRAESNLQLAMDALDTVYLQAVGRDRVFGDLDPKEAQQQLTDREKKLLQAGLDFYTQIAGRNESDRAATFGAAKAFLQIGKLRASLNEDQEAITAFSEATSRLEQLTESFPDNADYFKHLSDAYSSKAELDRFSQRYKKTLVDAERAVSRAIELSPKDANAYHRRVWIRYKQRQFKEAISDFEKVIELNPDDVDFLYQLGQFIFFTSVGGENKRRSLELTKKAVRLAPQVARYHASLGRIYWDVLKDRKLAIDELDKAIELDPNLVTAYVQRKIVYESIDLPRALEEINTALQLDPESAYALRHRGAIYNTLGRLDEALSDYNESERFKPHDCLVYLGRGELYLRREQYEAALSDLNKSIELDATRYHVYKRRALAHFHLGHYDEALSDIAKAVELNPRDTSNLRWGWLDDLATCPDEGFREGLLALADKTIELTDHSARAYAMRGWILAVLGQEEKALADLKTAFSKLPNADESGELSSSSSCYELGKLCGQLAHRQEVTPYLAKMPEIQPENTIHSYRAALAQLGAGQTDSYRDTCRGMLQQFQDTEM